LASSFLSIALFVPIGMAPEVLAEPDHRHHVAVFAGYTYHPKDNQSGGAYALEYEYRLHDHFGVGGVLEFTSGIEDDPIVVVVPLLIHPISDLKLMVGPGYEFKREEHFLIRLGVGWDFHLNEHLLLTPQVTADLLSGNTNYNMGLALGWAF
jgi:hypothetical protein